MTGELSALRHDLRIIVRAALEACDGGRLLERALGRALASHANGTGPGQVRLISAGKAARAMTVAAARLLGPRIRVGVVICPDSTNDLEGFDVLAGGHPLPDERSERAGRRAIAVASSGPAAEPLLVALSGGASALMAVPALQTTVGIATRLDIDLKRRVTESLLRAGADIHELNTVRKHLSAIKGGRLAACSPSESWTFALSDVVGDDLGVIASGPTVADDTTFADALEILRRCGGLEGFPAPVVEHLQAGIRGDVPETPKPGDARLVRATARVIGGRRDAMAGAAEKASELGYHALCIEDPVVGEAAAAAAPLCDAIASRARELRRPACVVSSGETTVRVTGHGKGGRNLELALALVAPLAAIGAPAAVASVGTDGIDGPTDAAGALVDSASLGRAETARLGDPVRYFEDNNSYAFFEGLGDLIRTGPTNTNVGDLQVFLFG